MTFPGASGSLGDSSKAILIDGIAPTIENISLTSADGTYSAVDNKTYNVNFNGKSKGNVDKAVVGINHIALIIPEPEAYNNCTMTLTDSSNNISQLLKIPYFVLVEGQ